MAPPAVTSSFWPSLDTLRRYHLSKYRRWVWIGVLVSLAGYTASSVSFTLNRSWAAALGTGDPFVVLANMVALVALLRGHHRAAAGIALAAAFIDLHYSLVVLQMPTLANIGLILPGFVFCTALFFGGRAALGAAGLLVVSVPSTLWIAAALRGSGLDSSVRHFLVVLEVVLMANTALLLAFLRTFAEILEQHRAGEARRLELQTALQHSQKLEALGLLAGGIAHDFNNLLTAFAGYGSLLERSADPVARELGAEIVAAQERGAKLTKQLLAFARKDIAQPRPVDLARMLADLTSLLKRAAGAKARLHIEAEPGCVIVADPGRIEQVVFNFAVNARDAMPDGGRLWIRCSRSDHQVTLEVEDEGVGIDEPTQLRVFEPFFTTKDRHKGTGLGLSTVHGIVSDSGGTIELVSAVGRGTRFTVRWPRSAMVPDADTGGEVLLEGAGRSVLLVEDTDGARSYIQRVLLERGFRVTAARSAEEALTLAAELGSPPDLVLSDVILPGLTGPDLVARLKERWPELVCLFVSGYVGNVALGPGFDPAVDLVPKPFTPSELLTRVAGKVGNVQ